MLAECVESVKQQTLTVADHLILLDTERKGGAWTKQQLLEQVKTEWCILLDDDDLIDPDYCKRLTDEAGDADVIYGWCRSARCSSPRPHEPSVAFLRLRATT